MRTRAAVYASAVALRCCVRAVHRDSRQHGESTRAVATADPPVESKSKSRKRKSSPTPDGAPPNNKLRILSDSKLESEMKKSEDRLADIDQLLADGGTYEDGDRVAELQSERTRLAPQLKELEDEWIRRQEEGP